MSLKEATDPRHITAGAWSGLAAPAAAGAAVHSTAPWYVAVPVAAAALALTIWPAPQGRRAIRAGTIRWIVGPENADLHGIARHAADQTRNPR